MNELRALLRLAAPIAVSQAGFALMGLVDTAVVGRLGAAALGGVGLANGIFFAVAVLGIGAMMGLDPLFAQAFGARDHLRARALLAQSLWLALLLSLLLALPVLCLPLVLWPFHVAESVIPVARGFLYWRLPGLWPMLAFTGVRSYLQSAHRVRVLVIATVIANVANLLLDLLFVYGPLGAPGAGLATSLCSLLQFAILWADARGGEPVPRAPSAPDLRIALRVGLPVGLQQCAEVGVFALVGLFAGRLGAVSLAAHQIALSLASFTFCFAVGVGSAGAVRVGHAVGARDPAQVRRSGFLSFALGLGIMSLSALTFALAPFAVARLLSDQGDVLAVAAPLLGVCAMFQLSDGVQAVGAGVLRGAGDTRVPFLVNVIGHYAIGLPIAVLLGARLGVVGLWWGLAAGLTAVALALLARFARLSSRAIEPLESHVPV